VVVTLLNLNMITKLKATFLIKSNILVSNYIIQYQILNNVSMHGILTRKKVIKTSLLLLLVPLIFFSSCLPYKTPAAVSQNICFILSKYLHSIFHCTTIHFGKYRDGNFHHVHHGRLVRFGNKKIQMGKQTEFSITCFTPLHCMMKLAHAQFQCNFSLFIA